MGYHVSYNACSDEILWVSLTWHVLLLATPCNTSEGVDLKLNHQCIFPRFLLGTLEEI